MPIVRAGSRLLYFAHVPKCGGDSVERYLARRFGAPALLDRMFLERPPAAAATRVSPQHLTAAQLAVLFPPRFFDASFALIRHPVARMVSEYHYDVQLRALRPAPAFGAWLREARELARQDPGARDNHLLPQTAFLPDRDTALFPLEDGMAPLIAWLDRVTGTVAPRLRMPHANRGTRAAGAAAADLAGPAEIAIIADWFAADFDRFGYPPALPDASAEPRRSWWQAARNRWRTLRRRGP